MMFGEVSTLLNIVKDFVTNITYTTILNWQTLNKRIINIIYYDVPI